METILHLIQYNNYGWRVFCDLNVVAILIGIKQGFSKHQCFLCNSEGRQTKLHYTDHQWKAREDYQVGVASVVNTPLIDKEKVILPPLHIKLGLMRNFVRALDHDSAPFRHLKTIFPKLTEAKIDAGKFSGLHNIPYKSISRIFNWFKFLFCFPNQVFSMASKLTKYSRAHAVGYLESSIWRNARLQPTISGCSEFEYSIYAFRFLQYCHMRICHSTI